MKRFAQTAMVVSLAMAAASAMADNTSAFPKASSPYYNSLADAPAVMVYGGAAAASSADGTTYQAQPTNAQQSGQWHQALAGAPVTYESASAAETGYDAWPQREDGPQYWTTHAPGGSPLAGTEDAAREQHRLAQVHALFGS